MKPGDLRARMRSRPWGATLLVCAVGGALSLAGYVASDRAEQRRVESVIEFRTDWRALDIQSKIAAAFAPIEAVAAFAATRSALDPAEFGQFARRARGVDGPIRAIVWAPRVPAAARAAFELAGQQAGTPGFGIVEPGRGGARVAAAPRPEYFPVATYAAFEAITIEPGLDLGADRERRAAVLQAAETGMPLMLRAAPLAGPPGSPPTLQVYWPIFAGGAVPDTAAARRQGLRGIVAGLFRVEAVIENAMRDTPAPAGPIEFLIRDIPGNGTATAVAHFDFAAGKIVPGGRPAGAPGAIALSVSRTFSVLGREWILNLGFDPAVVGNLRSGAPEGWLFAGLLLTLLIALFVQRQRQRTVEVEALVAQRTQALTSANQSLQGEMRERQEMQDRYRELIELSPDAICVHGDGKLVFVNTAAVRLYGAGDAGQLIGRPMLGLVHPDDREKAEADTQRIAAGARPAAPVEIRHLRLDGKPVLVETVASALTYAGKPAVQSIVRDITERRHTEQQLVQAQKMETVGQLTGGLAHDFNNLLSVVIGNLDMLAARLKSDPQGAELAEDALKGALRGAELVRRLLAFSRRQPLMPKVFDLRSVVGEIAPLLRRTLGEQIVVETKCGAEVWPVRADPVQLESVILNLAINARDAMPGGGHLYIECSNVTIDEHFAAAYRDLAPGDYAVLTVRDTGTGMTPDVLAKAFEPFFTTKPPGSGSGLGLSMAHGYMKQSGGTVNIYSEPGHGTSVRLYLPRAPDGKQPAAGPAPGDLKRATHGQHVLVVEDSPEVRRIAVRVLGDLGYRVTEAADAAAALAALDRGEPFDLLFSDIVMPGALNGLGLAREVRQRFPHLKILFTSGFTSQNSLRAEIETLGADLIVKPYRARELAERVHRLLDQRPE